MVGQLQVDLFALLTPLMRKALGLRWGCLGHFGKRQIPNLVFCFLYALENEISWFGGIRGRTCSWTRKCISLFEVQITKRPPLVQGLGRERERERERAGYHQCVLYPSVGIAIGFLHRDFDGLGGESPFESALTISYAENEDILQPTFPIPKILTPGPLSCSESHF